MEDDKAVEKHLPGEHDQSTHGGKGTKSPSEKPEDNPRYHQLYLSKKDFAATYGEGVAREVAKMFAGGGLVGTYEISRYSKQAHPDKDQRKLNKDILRYVNFLNRSVGFKSEVGKHLPMQHDQKAHGGTHGATPQEIKTGKRKKSSSLESKMKGQKIGNHIVKSVKKTDNKKERLVIFEDGSGMYFPSFALAKMVYGGTGKNAGRGDVAKMFKTAGELHKAGFTSWLQANFLLKNNKKVFNDIIADAKAGKRKWDQKERRIVIQKSSSASGELVVRHHQSGETEYERWLKTPKGKLLHEDTATEEEAENEDESGDLKFYSEREMMEGKHLPGQHDQQTHAVRGKGPRLSGPMKDVLNELNDEIAILEVDIEDKDFSQDKDYVAYANNQMKTLKRIRERVAMGDLSGARRSAAGFEESYNLGRNVQSALWPGIYDPYGQDRKDWAPYLKKSMTSEQLSKAAMDKEFAEVEDVPKSELIKYGRPASEKIVKKADMDDELMDEDKGYFEEDLEEPYEELEEGTEYEEAAELESAGGLAEAIVELYSGEPLAVDDIKKFGDEGLGFLGPGLCVYVSEYAYKLAIREMSSGDLTEEAVDENLIDPATSFQDDLITFLNGGEIPGLEDVSISEEDPAEVPVVSFRIDDGTEFRVYILGQLSVGYTDEGIVEMSVADKELIEKAIVEKADKECLQTIFGVSYKYYTGRWISTALEMQKAGKYDKAAEAFENARDGYQKERNPKEWNCLDAWRQEMEDKAA